MCEKLLVLRLRLLVMARLIHPCNSIDLHHTQCYTLHCYMLHRLCSCMRIMHFQIALHKETLTRCRILGVVCFATRADNSVCLVIFACVVSFFYRIGDPASTVKGGKKHCPTAGYLAREHFQLSEPYTRFQWLQQCQRLCCCAAVIEL